MKKKVHIILCIMISSFFVYGLVNLLASNTTQKLESLTDRCGGERMQNAKAFIQQYHRSGVKEVEDHFHPELLSQLVSAETLPIMQYFFKNQPQLIRSISYQSRAESNGTYRKYALQYDFSESPPTPLVPFFIDDFRETNDPYSLVLIFDELEKENITQIVHFSVTPLSIKQKQMGEFHLMKKSALHIGFLIAAIFIPLFILFNLIQFVRMPEACQKTLWFGFIASGLATVTLNWATGEVSYKLITLNLLGANISKIGMYIPWMISISIPVGALLFFFKRKKWITEYQNNQQSILSTQI